jgi:guanylate cyclase
MESHAAPGTIQVTERLRDVLRDRYEFRPRGTIEIKGKGPMACHLLIGRDGDGAARAERDRDASNR